jgi:hypothetical protein
MTSHVPYTTLRNPCSQTAYVSTASAADVLLEVPKLMYRRAAVKPGLKYNPQPAATCSPFGHRPVDFGYPRIAANTTPGTFDQPVVSSRKVILFIRMRAVRWL